MKGIKNVAGASKTLKNGEVAVIVSDNRNDSIRLEGPFHYNQQAQIEQVRNELTPYESGYLIYKPMTMAEIEYFLNGGSPSF